MSLVKSPTSCDSVMFIAKSRSAEAFMVVYWTDTPGCLSMIALPTSWACTFARMLALDTILIFLKFFNSSFVQAIYLFVISTGESNKYFVICANVIGGCMGSLGPRNINPETNQPYGLNFPVITIRDMVRAQETLLENLGIKKLLCATGGSMGGMQLLQFCSTFPDKTFSAIPIACSASHSAQNIALNELARQSIMADPVWDNGKYFLKNVQPKNGLAVARMVGHISYLSEKGMQEKFGRKLQEKADYEFSFNADFQVESYLRHQGYAFVERFDANSVLYITRAMDYFDLSKQFKGGLVEAFKNQRTKFLVISFSSDWLYTTKDNKDIVIALNASGADVSYSEIVTDKGHDSFLLDEPDFLKTLKGFIDSMYEKFKNEK